MLDGVANFVVVAVNGRSFTLAGSLNEALDKVWVLWVTYEIPSLKFHSLSVSYLLLNLLPVCVSFVIPAA